MIEFTLIDENVITINDDCNLIEQVDPDGVTSLMVSDHIIGVIHKENIVYIGFNGDQPVTLDFKSEEDACEFYTLLRSIVYRKL